jgi:hypothetical protein
MKATITAVGGRAPPGEIRRRLLQDLVGPPQLKHLAFELLEPLALLRGQPRPAPLVTLGLSHQFRNVSAEQPIFSAIDTIAAHCGSCSSDARAPSGPPAL